MSNEAFWWSLIHFRISFYFRSLEKIFIHSDEQVQMITAL